jgi:hypothetical protein
MGGPVRREGKAEGCRGCSELAWRGRGRPQPAECHAAVSDDRTSEGRPPEGPVVLLTKWSDVALSKTPCRPHAVGATEPEPIRVIGMIGNTVTTGIRQIGSYDHTLVFDIPRRVPRRRTWPSQRTPAKTACHRGRQDPHTATSVAQRLGRLASKVARMIGNTVRWAYVGRVIQSYVGIRQLGAAGAPQ